MMTSTLITRSPLIFLVLLVCSTLSGAQEIHELNHADLWRAYTITLPDSYSAESPIPLVIVLHGSGGDSITMQLTTQFAELANESGYLIAFPNGVSNGWNYLDEEALSSSESFVDDIGFIEAMIEEISANYSVNPDQIYIIGYSNGALLALRLSCDLADRLDGVISIAGTYSYEIIQHCTGGPAVPILFVWGTEDNAFPTGGYVIETENGIIQSSFSLAQTRSYIRTHYACAERPQAMHAETESSPYAVILESYTNCRNQASAGFMILVDHDHGFPIAPRLILSNGTPGSIQEGIWDFIYQQTLDQP